MIISFEQARQRLRGKANSRLAREIGATLSPEMVLPAPLIQLFDWIEAKGFYDDTEKGRMGFLFPRHELREGKIIAGRPGATDIRFIGERGSDLMYWFDSDNPEIAQRLSAFASTGCEGSMAAFWLADDGSQKIVHMGTGSGSAMVCVLADDPIDFLRLIAIGYDEICWGEQFSQTPAEIAEDVLRPNRAFTDWVTRTFEVSIPERGVEIVKSFSLMDGEGSSDPFWQWSRRIAYQL